MSQELPNEQNDQSELERTQPSAPPPRSLDWRPPEYQAQEPEESPLVRRVPPPNRRRRPPTEGAPAWVVGLGVGALLAVILLLAVAFVLSRPPAEPDPTATVVVVTPTETLVPRATFTPIPATTPTSAEQPGATEAAPAATGIAPDTITVGGYVRVAAPAGLSFREAANTSGTLIELLETGTVLSVIGGPQQAGGFTWWQLRKLDDGKEGWSAAGSGEDVFLEPAPAP